MAYDLNPFKKGAAAAEEWLKKELQQVRTGTASPAVLDGVKVEAYGAALALREVASVLIEGARTLRISPWDKAQIKDIEKALSAADLGLSVAVDDQGLRVSFPELTAERRKDFVKLAKDRLEEAKREVRARRDEAMKDIQTKEKEGGFGKDDIFRLKQEIQKLVDGANRKLDEICARKGKEILS